MSDVLDIGTRVLSCSLEPEFVSLRFILRDDRELWLGRRFRMTLLGRTIEGTIDSYWSKSHVGAFGGPTGSAEIDATIRVTEGLVG